MPRNINELTERIRIEAEAIKEKPDLVRRAVRDMMRRTELCIERRGGRVEKNF